MDESKANNFCIYCRVSTKEQGDSGLGLTAQLDTCRKYIKTQNGNIVGEFYDVKSGSSRNRQGLISAIAIAKEKRAVLVFAKLDRLSRDAEYAYAIRNSGVPLYFCDFPQINSLLFGILVAVAQYEKELGQKRTKDALDAIKRNIAENGYHTSKSGNAITQLGAKKGEATIYQAQAAAAEAKANKISADKTRHRQYLLVCDLRSRGDSLDEIAATLNATGEKAPNGGYWSKAQIHTVINNWSKYFLK